MIRIATTAPAISFGVGVFGRLLKKPARPNTPAKIPISTATTANAAA